MAYLDDVIREKLGNDNLVGAQGYDYKDWSPNNYRGIHIIGTKVYIERFVHPAGAPFQIIHLNKDKLNASYNEMLSQVRKGVRKGISSPLKNILKEKEFQNLEEISIAGPLVEGWGLGEGEMLFPTFFDDIKEAVSNKVTGGFRRFRAINLVLDDTVIPDQALQEARGRKPDALFSQLWVDCGGDRNHSGFYALPTDLEDSGEWRTSIGLNPIYYKLDLQGGPLEKALNKFKPSVLDDVYKHHMSSFEADKETDKMPGGLTALEEIYNDLNSQGLGEKAMKMIHDSDRVPYLRGYSKETDEFYLGKHAVLTSLLLSPVEGGVLEKDPEKAKQIPSDGYYDRQKVFSVLASFLGVDIEYFQKTHPDFDFKGLVASGSMDTLVDKVPTEDEPKLEAEIDRLTKVAPVQEYFFLRIARLVLDGFDSGSRRGGSTGALSDEDVRGINNRVGSIVETFLPMSLEHKRILHTVMKNPSNPSASLGEKSDLLYPGVKKLLLRWGYIPGKGEKGDPSVDMNTILGDERLAVLMGTEFLTEAENKELIGDKSPVGTGFNPDALKGVGLQGVLHRIKKGHSPFGIILD